MRKTAKNFSTPTGIITMAQQTVDTNSKIRNRAILEGGCYVWNAAMRMPRRHFLRGATASAIILSLTDWLNAQPTVSRPMRSDVNSQNGKKMLALYKRAVAEMRSDKWPAHHPFSWTFQANIHDYPVNEPH